MARNFAQSLVIALGLLLFFALGGIGFLLDHLFRSPGLLRKLKQLKTHVKSLEQEVDRLETSIHDLGNENDRFQVLNDELNVTVDELAASNARFAQLNLQLDRSNIELQYLVQDLGNQTAAMEQTNSELMSIVGFFNATSIGLGKSVEQVSAFLEDGIQSYRASSLRALELDYVLQIRSWDCDFYNFFSGEPFEEDNQVPIGSGRYSDVRSYLKDRLFDNLCLDLTNWEKFMESVFLEGPIITLTTDELLRGVANYTRQALEFYFADGGENVPGALGSNDWFVADFECVNLERSFVWT